MMEVARRERDNDFVAKSIIQILIITGAMLLVVAVSKGETYDPYWPYRPVCEVRVGGSVGSGFMIATKGDQCLVLTCRHVAPVRGQQVQVHWPSAGGQPGLGHVALHPVDSPPQGDIAAIVCDRPVGVKPLRHGSLLAGPYTAIGYRKGSLRTTRTPDVSWKKGLCYMPAPFVQGMSGGPVVDRYGNFQAIVAMSDFETVGIAVDGQALHAIIRAFKKN